MTHSSLPADAGNGSPDLAALQAEIEALRAQLEAAREEKDLGLVVRLTDQRGIEILGAVGARKLRCFRDDLDRLEKAIQIAHRNGVYESAISRDEYAAMKAAR